jgi:ubiquinone/menaquinone biosynthesis C-methylase UbiE
VKDYKQLWDDLSNSWADASFYVCYIDDEDDIRRNGQYTANFLREVLQIGPEDKVLEIGCGVARVGRELAPCCAEWHGSDISGNMIAYAADRTRGLPNVHLHELPDNNLSIFPDNYFDVVYSTIVFMHLDKMDVFTYIVEAHRVLKPGGRAYFDAYNILAPEAWREFRRAIEQFPSNARPRHVSQFSTPQEMQKFMEEAGFETIRIDGENNPQLVIALGRKSELALESTSTDNASTDNASRSLDAGTLSGSVTSARGADGAALGGDTPQQPQGRQASALELRAQLDAAVKAMETKDRAIQEMRSEIARRDRAIEVKNRHITRLERIIQRHEQMLSTLPVRVALRLRRTFRLPRFG